MKFNVLARYLKYFSLALMVVFLGLTVSFLYLNFYETITQARVIYNLKNQVDFELIDVHLYNQINQNLANKNSLLEIKVRELNNPFAAPVAASAPATPVAP
jgi:hypothetical protein